MSVWSTWTEQVTCWAREWLNVPPRVGDALEPFAWVWSSAVPSPTRRTLPRLFVSVATHARADALGRLLPVLVEHLRGLEGVADVANVCVLEDRSPVAYPPSLTDPLGQVPSQWLRSRTHLGKAQHWRLWQAAFALAQRSDADYALFIQDDMELDAQALSRALSLMRVLERTSHAPDVRPRVLSLFSAHDDERFGRWVFFPRRRLRALPLRQTQWFDLPAVLMNRAALTTLGYRVVPVATSRFVRNPRASSGVGRQFTRRLYARAGIYQCVPSLVFHGAEPSTMNPEARQQRPMDNRPEHIRAARD